MQASPTYILSLFVIHIPLSLTHIPLSLSLTHIPLSLSLTHILLSLSLTHFLLCLSLTHILLSRSLNNKMISVFACYAGRKCTRKTRNFWSQHLRAHAVGLYVIVYFLT